MECLKLTILAIAIVAVGIVAGGGSQAEARSPSEPLLLKIVTGEVSKVVTGEVSKVEGEFKMSKDRQGEDLLDIVDTSYIITDQSGKEVRVGLDDHTKIRKRVNPGDKVEAKISSEGHTLSVTRIEP